MKHLSGNNLLRITYAILYLPIFIPLTVTSQEKSIKEKYLITTSGGKISIKTISSLSGDTLFLITKNGTTFIHIDSVDEYHSTAPRREGRGFFIGAASGIITGAIIGAATAPDPDYTNITTTITTFETQVNYPLVGGLIGLVLGGGIGYLIGNALYENTHYDFRTMSKERKNNILSYLIYK